MKVLIDGVVFARQRAGGISRMWEEILPRLATSQLHIDFITPVWTRNQSLRRVLERAPDLEILRDYLYWPSRWFDRVQVRSKLLSTQYVDKSVEVFHSTYFTTVYDRKVKKVVTVYDMILELFEKANPGKWTQFQLKNKMEVIKNADRLVAISENTKVDLLRIYPWVQEDHVQVIYNGCPAIGVEKSGSLGDFSIPALHALTPKKYFLFVGRKSGYKNFDLLLRLMKTRREYREWIFVCVGGGDDDQVIEKLEEDGLASRFILLGLVSDECLQALYHNAAALVFPSLYEGFGFPILEAMAMECPVLCSNTSCFPEVAGNAALFFDPRSVDSLANAIDLLVASKREDLVKKGLENVQRFSWADSTRTLINLYETLPRLSERY